jgi:hypothetical protein
MTVTTCLGIACVPCDADTCIARYREIFGGQRISEGDTYVRAFASPGVAEVPLKLISTVRHRSCCPNGQKLESKKKLPRAFEGEQYNFNSEAGLKENKTSCHCNNFLIYI